MYLLNILSKAENCVEEPPGELSSISLIALEHKQ